MFQKLWYSDTCNQVKSCTEHGRLNLLVLKTQDRSLNCPFICLCYVFQLMCLLCVIAQYQTYSGLGRVHPVRDPEANPARNPVRPAFR